tara:strand:+ start:1249 stop:2253 length:1005 start_codon:yes stop_codon:yes gene_type:complete
MRISSFFTGAGGLDLGFKKSGAQILYANEFDKKIWSTFELNFTKRSNTYLDKRSITEVDASEVPDCEGIIGGPPCQSWSEAGALRGIDDKRGQLFFDFIRILKTKKPLFFLAENVSGMLAGRHSEALKNIIQLFKKSGYVVTYELLNASDFGVPQDRKRVIFVGYRRDLDKKFIHPSPTTLSIDHKLTLKDAIWDLRNNALPAKEKNQSNYEKCKVPNHEYMIGGFSTIYMSRNRVRPWNGQSFTIQAGGRHAPIHPQAPEMEHVEKNKKIFVADKEHLYRRLSVRECARIQTFPDDFIFDYDNVAEGYKMIGNAVPVDFAKILADQIKSDLGL